MRGMRAVPVLLALLFGVAISAKGEKILIHTPKPYKGVVQEIQRRGGTVSHEFRYVDAIAADVPPAALTAIRALVGEKAVQKDLIVRQPGVALDRNRAPLLSSAEGAETVTLGSSQLPALIGAHPDAYLINNAFMNLGTVHGQGFTGQGIRVAVIDSGLRPSFPTIAGKVLGGEDFVHDGLGFLNAANEGHGTFVAGMIVSAVALGFAPGSAFPTAVSRYCPACVLTLPPSTLAYVPILGSAPDSRVYSLRIFGPTGGSPTSRVIAAMEKVIALREQFDATHVETQNPDGSYSSLNVKVCNMSLGGLAFYAGRELEDQLTSAFLSHDIVLAIAAGNEGPAGSTIGSPGTGFDALTVGAGSTSVHERILRDLQFGPTRGLAYRPFSGTQTAYFSSRGPTADGRSDPELVANGFASYGMGFGSTASTINIASGTSFATPSVAGVAASLRQAAPGATARQVRNALRLTANPSIVQDGSGVFDRGRGFVDAAAALGLLRSGMAPNTPGATGGTETEVKENIEELTPIRVSKGNVTRRASNLLPGQRFETYYEIEPEIKTVIVTLFAVQRGTVQNQLFGDDVLLTVHSAKTGDDDYPVFEFTTGGSFTIPNPESGLLRITLSGDWTNASPISASVNITAMDGDLTRPFVSSEVADGASQAVPFTVASGVKSLDLRLEWSDDWSKYPTDDLDLILIDPAGTAHFEGATADAPELVHIASPRAGVWTAIVDGFAVLSRGATEKFKLRIAADGRPLAR